MSSSPSAHSPHGETRELASAPLVVSDPTLVSQDYDLLVLLIVLAGAFFLAQAIRRVRADNNVAHLLLLVLPFLLLPLLLLLSLYLLSLRSFISLLHLLPHKLLVYSKVALFRESIMVLHKAFP